MRESVRQWIIKKLGGLVSIDDAIEAIKQTDSPKRYEILTLAVKRFFNTISADDILQVRKETGEWLLEGKPISDAEQGLLIAQAKQFDESKLWAILQRDVKYQANKAMYVKGDKVDDLIAGKLWTF